MSIMIRYNNVIRKYFVFPRVPPLNFTGIQIINLKPPMFASVCKIYRKYLVKYKYLFNTNFSIFNKKKQSFFII